MALKSFKADLSDQGVAELLGISVERARRARLQNELVLRVARAIRAQREANAMSQQQVADALGVSAGRISQFESGDLRHTPNLKTLADLSDVFQCDPFDFFKLRSIGETIQLDSRTLAWARRQEKPVPD